MPIPKHDELMNPLMQAMHNLGGSASVAELEDEVAKIMGLSEADASVIYKGNRTKFGYNLAWARTYLKLYGVLVNSKWGVWALSSTGRKTKSVDPVDVKRAVAAKVKKDKADDAETPGQLVINEVAWVDQALDVVKKLKSDAFERLCQRILRECGFVQVEVTGRAGDGGIDGNGVVKLGGILSFHVFFQCKRYKNVVTASAVRDFRGAMVGRGDKGLLITTGTFTADAKKEASREGAPPLDLIDGRELVQKLKELGLGISVTEKTLEDIRINEEWFEEI